MNPALSLKRAQETAQAIAKSSDYSNFVEVIRKLRPAMFESPLAVIERDYLRIVDHHLEHLLPQVQRYIDSSVRRVLDFGCGSGGSAIALAMVYPELHCVGTDIDGEQILPLADNSFDYCQCSSVLEYCTDVPIRKFCIGEMVRLVKPEGLLFFSVPNRLYPFEIHTRKWGWNYFPEWFNARTVDSTFWEVRKLARPSALKLYRTPLMQLFRPWSNFCLKKESGASVR
jgi:SAM-dependent methyltransferase